MYGHAQWETSLAKTIAAALIEISGMTRDEMKMFDVDCHPWNGEVFLALLSAVEAESDPSLANVCACAPREPLADSVR